MSEFPVPEMVQGISQFALVAIPLLGMALSAKQRQSILERDGNRCQVPVVHPCNGNELKPNGTKNLQVDHVIPQRWGQDVLGMTEEELDVPENLVTECEYFHQNIRHPDMQEQHLAWKYNKGDHRVFDRRDQMVREGKPYWFTVYDALLKEKAIELTAKAKEGWIFPKKKHGSKKNTNGGEHSSGEQGNR